jgi:hypothetical protein
VSDQEYDLVCKRRTTVICKADDGSDVRFAMAAVAAYDAEQAAAYCEKHDTTGRGRGVGCAKAEPDPAPRSDAPPGADACDPNYAGACLDPVALDYDCEGSRENGPQYTGTVQVVGGDPYDLDPDGDGIACDG